MSKESGSTQMNVPAFESGVVRLFAIDLPSDQIEAFKTYLSTSENDTQWPLKDALGATFLNENFVEVFPVSDLDGLGLAGYLSTGNEVPADQVDQMAHQLSLVKGHVVLVLSSAFGGFAQSLHPTSPLRHIATFFTEGTPVTFEPLPDDSAQLGSGDDDIKPAKKKPSEAAMSGRIATYALLFMFVFTGLIIWIGS
tara:strand:- start:4843 stop:5430 length:588 start_codon:yes stop_codon:yes gene_type:complete